MSCKRIIAIDVGNGFGKAAICTDPSRNPDDLLPKWKVGMPTVAYIGDDGSIQVEHKARNKKAGRAATAVKSYIGNSGAKTHDGTPYDAAKAYGVLAAELIREANASIQGDPVYEVVLTYPSAFIKDRNMTANVEMMRKAVEDQIIDGKRVSVVQTISEAAAAALDTLYFERNLNDYSTNKNSEELTVMVCDVGHGTFDLAVVTSCKEKEKPFDIIMQDGDPEIGGKVFNTKLYNKIISNLKAEYPDLKLSARNNEQLITQIVPQIKHDLSDDDVTEVTSHDLFVDDIGYIDISIKRSEFEQLIRTSVGKMVELTSIYMDKAKKIGKNVKELILTGGSSRIPMIKREISKLKEVYPDVNIRIFRPEHGVVFGAARYAAGLATVEHPEYAYGLRYSEGLVNMVDICLKSEDILEAKGGSLKKKANGVVVTAEVFRSKDKYLKSSSPIKQADCESVQFFSFDVGPERNMVCTLSIGMDKERRITAYCTLPDGKVLKKNWYDED